MLSNRATVAVIITAFCCAVSSPAQTTHSGVALYVDGRVNGGDGKSWCTAFQSLDEALAQAGYGTVIRVARGRYRPSTIGLSDPRDATFLIPDGVTLQGGYRGCGSPDPGHRNSARHATILCGDLLDNDDGTTPSRADNGYHVVSIIDADGTTTLDGLTVCHGHANGPNVGPSPESRDQGSAVNIYHSQPVISECVFRNNHAANHGTVNDHGGAVISRCRFEYNESENLGAALYIHTEIDTIVTDCEFRRNTTTGKGGAIYFRGNSLSEVTSSKFIGNHATQGGAVYCDQASRPLFTGCEFVNNSAASHESFGGAMYNDLESSPTVDNCLFHANRVFGLKSGGAAMYNVNGSAPLISQTRFVDNVASRYGGGIYNKEGASPTIQHCVFVGNASEGAAGLGDLDDDPQNLSSGGGALLNTLDSHPFLLNCLFANNRAQVFGAAIYNYHAYALLEGCTIVGNDAGCQGGGIFNRGDTPGFEILNSILWGNRDDQGVVENAQITVTTGTLPTIEFSCVEGWSGRFGGTGNFSLKPRFTHGPAGCVYLSQPGRDNAESPCVNAGSADAERTGMNVMTTSPTEMPDEGIVDIGMHYYRLNLPILHGDVDFNRTIDLADYAGFQRCFASVGEDAHELCCQVFESNGLPGIDLIDHAALANAMKP